MSFTDTAKNTGRGLVIAAAVIAAGSLTMAPSAAYAEHWNHGWHGGGNHWHGHHHGGGGVALGILGGALAAGAIASAANPYYYSYGYPYYPSYNGYYYPY
jgi:hypothetical protein